MNVKRILSLVIIASLVLAVGLVTPRQSTAADMITIKQWYHQYGEEGTQQAVLRYADEYMKLNPNIKIEVTWVPGDYEAKLAAALLTNDGPDVFERPGVDTAIVAAKQAAPLDDLFTDEVKKDFGQTITENTVGGKIYGVKMIIDTTVLYYRKSMLDKAGVKPPTTMDELIDAVKKLGTGKVKSIFLGNDAIGLQAPMLVWSAGGDYIRDGKVAFNTDAVATVYAKSAELSKLPGVLVGAPTDWWDPSAFTDGQVAIQHCGLWAMPAIQKALGDDFGVLPWPALNADQKPSVLMGGWSELVNAKSQHVAEAKAFLKWQWIENITIQQDWSLNYGFHLPPRASAAASADKLKTGPAADVVKFVTSYGHLQRYPYWTTAMESALNDSLANVVKKGADPKTELQAAAAKIQKEYDDLMGTGK